MGEVIFSVCAFTWHLGDAILSTSKSHRKIRKFWAGVGVGWSAFFLATKLYQHYKKPRMVETKPRGFQSGYIIHGVAYNEKMEPVEWPF